MRRFTFLAIVLLLVAAGVFTLKTFDTTKAVATVASPPNVATINAYDLHLKADIQTLPVQENEDPI